MNTTSTSTALTTNTFEIVNTDTGFIVVRNGVPLMDEFGNVRRFVTRNSARKRISREKLGDFHN